MRRGFDLDRALVARVLERIGSPSVDLVLRNGTHVRSGSERAGHAAPQVRLNDRSTVLRAAVQGEVALADAYCDGRIDLVGDLAAFLTDLFRGWPARPAGATRGWWGRAARRWRSNTLRGSRRNIARHYDLGNDFYALWLDEGLSYTCAYYPRPGASLEEAQRAKLDHVARKLCLRPGERVVEAGGGWGSLAIHLARHYGVRVESYNVSHEQVVFARDRVRRERLDDRVEVIEDDYRNIRGPYDAFVSVGMLEHVGRDHFAELSGVLDRCLTSRGRGLLHSIGRVRPAPMDPWIEAHVFPGAYIPALGEMLQVLEPTDLAVLDVENLRLHYAKTLEHWLERFEKRADEVSARFGDRFVRAWRLYLAGSIASFRSGYCQLYQILFARPDCVAVPWTRDHLYGSAAPRGDE